MKRRTELSKITLQIPYVGAVEWKSDSEEARVLRDMADLVRTKRAFKIDRRLEDVNPTYFFNSLRESRKQVRELLQRLPIKDGGSRLVLIRLAELIGEILDSIERHTWTIDKASEVFERLSADSKQQVLSLSWPVVVKNRTDIDVIIRLIEDELSL